MSDQGFDYSAYASGALDVATLLRLKELGLVVPCWAMDTGDACIQTCMNAAQVGFPKQHAYRELDLNNPAGMAAAISNAVQAFSILAQQSIYFDTLWLTAETTGGDPNTHAEALAAAISAAQGFKIGLYSGDWYWNDNYIINRQQFESLPKWWAVYDGIAGIRDGTVAHQYAGSVNVAGANIDLDTWS